MIMIWRGFRPGRMMKIKLYIIRRDYSSADIIPATEAACKTEWKSTTGSYFPLRAAYLIESLSFASGRCFLLSSYFRHGKTLNERE